MMTEKVFMRLTPERSDEHLLRCSLKKKKSKINSPFSEAIITIFQPFYSVIGDIFL
jgi:hypothetical protein